MFELQCRREQRPARRRIHPRLRRYIYWRDGYRCTECGGEQQRKDRFTIHHINHDPRDNHPKNLRTMHQSCHTRLHKREG